MRLDRIRFIALLAGIATTTPAARAGFYTVKDLGTLAGSGQSSYADGINASGQIVGGSTYGTGGYYHAVVFNTNGTITDIGTLGGPSSGANAINDAGQVVGQADLANNGGSNAFFYDTHTGNAPTNLGTLPLNGNYSSSSANAINNSGTTVGSSNTAGFGIGHAVSFSIAGNTDLGPGSPTDASALSSVAYAINNNGLVGGAAFQAGVAAQHAALFSGGSVQYIGNLGTAPTNSSVVYGLNDSGQAVGYGQISYSANHAFLYNPTTKALVDIGTLGGNNANLSSYAYAINNAGTIVGDSQYSTSVFTSDPFVYANGVMTDLNSLVVGSSPFVTLDDAYAINASGQIVGDGTLADGTVHAFVLTPTAVPEPGSLGLLGAGVAGLLGLARARRRR